jgi:hypothetical protein
MVSSPEFGLPLEKILEIFNLIRTTLAEKNSKIDEQATELVSVKEQLAVAVGNDAEDTATIAQKESDASSARDELAAYKESVANNTQDKELLAAIAAFKGELGFATPPAA